MTKRGYLISIIQTASYVFFLFYSLSDISLYLYNTHTNLCVFLAEKLLNCLKYKIFVIFYTLIIRYKKNKLFKENAIKVCAKKILNENK